MWVLGLTGSIATGKSTVAKMFARRGIPVFSSDDAVHELYRGAAVAPVEALFPGVTTDGAIDRTKLSAHVLGHPERLKQLESVVHPLVRARLRAFLAEAKSTGAPIALLDIPLLFESGPDYRERYGLDRIAVTAVPDTVLRERALARPGMTVEKLDAILARQLPQDEKRKRADYVIDTGVPLAETEAAVAAIIADLTAHPRQEQ